MYGAPCAKNGRYSANERRNCCGAIDCWSTSTFEKSGENAPTNCVVASIGIVTSAPSARGDSFTVAPDGTTNESRLVPPLSVGKKRQSTAMYGHPGSV